MQQILFYTIRWISGYEYCFIDIKPFMNTEQVLISACPTRCSVLLVIASLFFALFHNFVKRVCLRIVMNEHK